MSEKMIACNLTFDEISKLADKVESGKLSKIKIKDGDCEIVIEKENKVQMPSMPQMAAPMMSMSVQTEAASSSSDTTTVPKAEEVKGNMVKAPIVGTFYSKPAPDKPAFVEVGKSVKKGDVLMIIESMKLMNEVQSDFDGVVKEILVSDGTAVEFDQPIMIIE